MNSLVGMGAVTSFTAGLAAPLVPGAALEVSFLEEPVMLLSFVLLGRALEARARLKASGAVLLLLITKVINASSSGLKQQRMSMDAFSKMSHYVVPYLRVSIS